MDSAGRLYSSFPFGLDSMHLFEVIPYRNKLRIPYAREASDSMHAYGVIWYERTGESGDEAQFAFRV